MASNDNWLEAFSGPFPGRDPRALLLRVYGTSAVVGVLMALVYVVGAFSIDGGLGLIVLIGAAVGLFVWLGLLRIALEAASAMFDMRDAMAQMNQVAPTVHENYEAALNQASDVNPRPRDIAEVRSADELVRMRDPIVVPGTAMSPTAVGGYLQDQAGATFAMIGEFFGVPTREVSEAIKGLEAEDLVARHRGGIYVYTGTPLDASSVTTDEVDDVNSGNTAPTGSMLLETDDAADPFVTRVEELPTVMDPPEVASTSAPETSFSPPSVPTAVVESKGAVPPNTAATPDLFCHSCGQELEADAIFCAKCGVRRRG